jgi:peptide/nickel transport system permease protein
MTTLDEAVAQTPTARRRRPKSKRGGGSLWVALRGNNKALAGIGIFGVFLIFSLVPGWFANESDTHPLAFPVKQGLSVHHLLGTTKLGQDIMSQIIFGTRQMIIIAVVAGLFATALSVIVGVTAAYLGGIVDDILSMLTNVILVIPALPLIIILAKYAGGATLTVMLSVLVATGWSYGANQLRAQALSLRNRDFLESARVRGERRSYIIVAELLPTMSSLIVANFLGAALYSVLTAASLQFLGLGDPSSVSWGTMLYQADGQLALQTGEPLWSLAPGLCVALLGAAFALINYAFDEISNPALRPVRIKRSRGRKEEQ